MPTQIKTSDVKVDGSSVTIHGAGGTALANSLIQKNSVTMGELADKFGFIHPEQVSIDKNGAVRIDNANLAAKVTAGMRGAVESDAIFDTNCKCPASNRV